MKATVGGRSRERWGAASGLVAVGAGATAMVFERGGLSPSAPPGEIAEFFTRNGPAQLTQSFLFVLGAGALLWFAGSLRSFLVRAEGDAGRLSAVVFGAAMVQITVNLVAQAFQIGMAGTPGGQVSPALLGVANALFILANLPMAVMLLATALVSWPHGAFPRWLDSLAVVAAAAHALLAGSFAVRGGPLAPDGWLAASLYPAFVVWLVPAAMFMVHRAGRPRGAGGPRQPRPEVREARDQGL
ncbi:hypothetical protein [Nonomuraea soli]|uniref:DUF4386 domain-containing protein n=1 Tax=Nonomuraea soli TaxID=1032476 RepID=A0A7W0HNN9_9ACTN|nr:hypothetical protein [Nonomuraea soli]MBA2890003.1 hypothetical protein [Nonomuraea soli]